MRDWKRIIKLSLPVKMRLGRGLRQVLNLTTGNAVGMAQDAEVWKDGVVDDMRVIGQRTPIESLLRNKFGAGISIEGYEPSNIVYFNSEPNASESVDGRYPGTAREDAVFMTPMSFVDIGADFVVRVPEGVNADEVAAMLARYVFQGIKFKVNRYENNQS